MQPVVLILNGPNLNRLGQRQPEIYGHETLDQIAEACRRRAAECGLAVDFRQSNAEGQLIEWVHQAAGTCRAIVLNAGAYTHTSIALADAVRSIELPVVEVHLSNIFAREAFRHHSFLSPVVQGVICGLGGLGYELALLAVARLLRTSHPAPPLA